DTECTAYDTNNQNQQDALNRCPALLNQSVDTKCNQQRKQLGQDAVEQSLQVNRRIADKDTQRGVTIVCNQTTDNEYTQNACSTGKFLCIGGQHGNCLGAQSVRPVHQPPTNHKLEYVK